MKQIVQNLNNGATSLIDVPVPQVMAGHLLIQSVYSLVSSGTERMLVDFGKANWINKARMQPERIQSVLQKIKSDGLKPTIASIKHKLSRPIPLGYAQAGIVLAVGEGVVGFSIGDPVVSNGPHAEIVQVPQNLVATIPPKVDFEAAAFTVVAAIALQGVRLVQPSFGETVVVLGLGLIGQLTVQLLVANGCQVIGIDPRKDRCVLAEKWGAKTICNAHEDSVVAIVQELSKGLGADAVLITASSTGKELMHQAAQMSRKRGRIVLVGVVGLQLNRADFYEKELSFQVSCSYGPGRYDWQYEQLGQDYPLAYVRWTAKRNFEAVLQAMASGALNIHPLISQKIALHEYEKAYDPEYTKQHLGILFEYPKTVDHSRSIAVGQKVPTARAGMLALIGAGDFSAKIIVPQLIRNKLPIKVIASEKGLSAAQLAKEYAVPLATTDVSTIWSDPTIETVFIATRHNSHAALCLEALKAKKNVFLEKPLALNMSEIAQIKQAYEASNQVLNIGFNRRHAPFAVKMKSLLGEQPSLMNIVMTVNAGKLQANTWLRDAAISGGRIIGEVCHFIDLAQYLSGQLITAVCANAMASGEEDLSILLRFGQGSTACINYFSNGHKAYDKERVEVYSQGKTLVLENWKKLSAYGCNGYSSKSTSQDKGHIRQFALLSERIQKGGPSLIPFEQILNSAVAAIAIEQSIREQRWVQL